MATARISGAEYKISQIFSDRFVFEIPPYQRPYAWDTEHAEELLEDLLHCIEGDSEPVKKLDPYFLGSIVLIKKEGDPHAKIVDGQQRITTLTILIAVLRSLADENRSDKLEEFLLEEGNPYRGTSNRFRLTVRDRDADFFKEYIQQGGGFESLQEMDEKQLSDPRQNMRNNTLLYRERLEEMSKEKRERLASYLLQQCYLVAVSTPTQKSAYRIFSVLNDRGLNLSHTDILKADILGAIEEEARHEYADRWDELEETMGRDEFQDLFRHIRTIYRKVKQQDTLVEEVRSYVEPAENPKQFINETLTPFADTYMTIESAAYESTNLADKVNQHLRWLNRVDNTDWMPPAILFMTRNENSPRLLWAFFEQLERLAAGMMMYRANVNERIRRYAKVLELIENDGDPLQEGSPLYLDPDEQLQVMKAVSGDLYNERKIRKYAMLRLDAALSEGEAIYDHDLLSIEHVLPQNPPPGSQWTQWFPDRETREAYVHRVGNLVLLSRRRNSSAKNYEFEKKKEKYFKTRGSVSAFAITTQVVNHDIWTPGIVEERQLELLEKFKEVWKLDAITDEQLLQLAEIPGEEALL